MRWPAAVVTALVVALGLGFGTANADGEVGIVMQIGDDVETYCVAYEGESITGEQALVRAGFSVEQLGGGTRAVCAIDDVGCFDASSFSSCFCECQGRDCTYWAFFTREYGAGWVYSTLGFNLLKATDGDVHGWKWGAGGPSSAPAPVDVTFEQICGHAPQSLNPPTATATTAAPASTATSAPGVSPSPAEASPTDGPPATVTAVPSRTASVTVGAVGATKTAVTPGVVVTIGNTPEPPDTAGPGEDDSGGSGDGGLIAAGAIGAGLLAAIGGAAVWRKRNGA